MNLTLLYAVKKNVCPLILNAQNYGTTFNYTSEKDLGHKVTNEPCFCTNLKRNFL
jgi:hypothetical protein